MVGLEHHLDFLPEYPYGVNLQGAKFGSFLKDPNLLHHQDSNFPHFIEKLKHFFPVDHVHYLHQIHSDEIIQINQTADLKMPLFADAMITKERRRMLLAFHADCQIAFFFDAKRKIIGIAHAGFKGQVLKIYTKMVQNFQQNYGSNPQDIQVVFSFSICKNHAEFINYQKEFPQCFWKYKNSNHFFDLKKMAKDELLQSGILEENIFMNPDCTVENEKIFYSYRATKTMKRHLSYLYLD